MKNKSYIKLALDVIMYVIFVLLMKIGFGGMSFHEIAGIGIGFVFIIHILFNLQWVKKVTLRLFDRKLPGKVRLGYLINILLLLSMTFIIVSGVLISRVVFPEFRIENQRWIQGDPYSCILSLTDFGRDSHWTPLAMDCLSCKENVQS